MSKPAANMKRSGVCHVCKHVVPVTRFGRIARIAQHLPDGRLRRGHDEFCKGSLQFQEKPTRARCACNAVGPGLCPIHHR